jgi:hypothetical protein
MSNGCTAVPHTDGPTRFILAGRRENKSIVFAEEVGLALRVPGGYQRRNVWEDEETTMRTVACGLVLVLVCAGNVRGEVIVYSVEKAFQPAVAADDQFGHFHSAAECRGDVAVFAYGDHAAEAANKALAQRLLLYFHPTAKGLPPAQALQAPVRPLPGLGPGQYSPDVRLLSVVPGPALPIILRGLVYAHYRSASPQERVWIDFEGQLQGQCGFVPGQANLAVLDTAGRLRCLARGPLTEGEIYQLTAVIESLRREATTAPR